MRLVAGVEALCQGRTCIGGGREDSRGIRGEITCVRRALGG